jgi:putative MATE family efflux protein
MTDSFHVSELELREPLRAITRLSFPIFVSAGLAASVALVDAYFVGRLGRTELAAMGYAFPCVFLGTSLAMGFSNGVRSAVSIRVGRGERSEILSSIRAGLVLCLGLFLALGLLAFLFSGRLAALVGVTGDVLPAFTQYVGPIYLSFIALGVQVAIGAVFMGLGDATTAAVLMIAAAVINAALVPVLVFGVGSIPAFGVKGAALATAAAWLSSALLGLGLMIKRGLLSLRFSRVDLSSARQICVIGLSFTVVAVIWPVGLSFVTKFIAPAGDDAVAAWGIATRIAFVARLGAVAIGAGTQVVVGRAWGQGSEELVEGALRASRRANYWFGIGAWALLAACSTLLAHAFDASPAISRYVANYLLIGPLGYASLGATIGVACACAAIERPSATLFLYVLCGAATLIPLCWLGFALAGPTGLFAGMTASALLSDVASFLVQRRVARARVPTMTPA